MQELMHQSAASPWDPLPEGALSGHLREPKSICQDCQIFVARVCGGKYHFCSIEIAPQGADPGDLLVSGIPYQ